MSKFSNWKTIKGNKVNVGNLYAGKSAYVPQSYPDKSSFLLPGIRKSLNESRALKEATKAERKRFQEKEKIASEKLSDEQKDYDIKRKKILKELKQGKIETGKAQQMLSKIKPKYNEERIVLPSGNLEKKENVKKYEKDLNKNIEINEKQQEIINSKFTSSGLAKPELSDDEKATLKKLQDEKKDLQIALSKINTKSDPSIFKNPLNPIDGRAKEADEVLPKDVEEKREGVAKSYKEGIEGEKVPTMGKYQTKRIDPYTGEFTSQLSDSKYEKQIASLIENAEKQQGNDLSNEQLAEALESISKNVQTDPTQYETPKGMGALIGLRASMAGRQ